MSRGARRVVRPEKGAGNGKVSGNGGAGANGGVRFTLDGAEVEARPDETIWQVARRCGTVIPHLCYTTAATYRPDGNCRICMVEIDGERVLAASCIRKPATGMVVRTDSKRAERSRNMVMELLLADQPLRDVARDPQSELWRWAETMGQLDRSPAKTTLPTRSCGPT